MSVECNTAAIWRSTKWASLLRVDEIRIDPKCKICRLNDIGQLPQVSFFARSRWPFWMTSIR